MAEEVQDVPTNDKKDSGTIAKKRKRGLMSRIWNGIFRLHGDDFEKRLQHISKEEAAVLARMKRRSQSWRRMVRHLIIFSVIFEVIAVGYAIMTTRSLELNWKMRAFRVLPMFLLPAMSSITYSALVSFTRMRDRKDQKTLERLRAERQAKIDELKERTNYYTTQQLIQRYDPDPAAKAAAATVLASKLGADSGLKVYVGDESNISAPTGKSNDVEFVQSSGLRNRKQLHSGSSSVTSTVLHPSDEEVHTSGNGSPTTSTHNQLVVEHYNPALATQGGGWIARIAALLVGEDPTQSYALICGNCHMHNGLARKEDYPYITYYCPHCNALNRSKEQVSGPASPNSVPSVTASNPSPIQTRSKSSDQDVISTPSTTSTSPVVSGVENSREGDTSVSEDHHPID
ncbi:hypothetical protein NMG60_11001317 [Bertholletia excelsa]